MPDLTNSVSTSRGYYTVTFGDGSELWLTWTGENKVTLPGKLIAGNGTAIVIGGKGRYEGAKGEGTFTGEMVQPGPGAIQYIDNVINEKNKFYGGGSTSWIILLQAAPARRWPPHLQSKRRRDAHL
jgi:hypothetical protein